MSVKTEARDRLLMFIDRDAAVEQGTTPEDAIADAIHEALLNQPALRTCLYPGCLHQYDSTAHMLGQPPVRPEWSGTGWHKVTRGPATGDLCPDHVDAVATHLPNHHRLPNGRLTASCACGWMSRPQTYGGLLRPLWKEHLLLVTGQLTAPVTLAETPGRLPLAEHTEATLTELYDQLEDAEHELAETRDAAQSMFKAWDWHRKTLGGVSSAINAVRNMMRISSRDWAADRGDAYLWALLIGWDDEALTEVAAKHRWDEHRLAYVRRMRGYLAPITDPQTEGAQDA